LWAMRRAAEPKPHSRSVVGDGRRRSPWRPWT
jgi:hypothetical protein